MKMVKSRKQCKCYSCKGQIQKGGFYARKSIRLGSNSSDSFENINGQQTIVSHGITVSVKHCAGCA